MITAAQLEEFPADVVTRAPGGSELDAEHKRIIGLVSAAGCGDWDTQHKLLKVNLFGLKMLAADPANKIKGEFDTIATGSGGQSDRNGYAHPIENGGWRVFRYGDAKEPSWQVSSKGNTYCEFNVKKRKAAAASPATEIVELALSKCELYHTPDNIPYASIGLENVPIADEQFAQHLRLWYRGDKGGSTAKAEWIKNAIEDLKAIANLDRPEKSVYLRIAGDVNRVYLDLCNAAREVVEITADGWRIIKESPFRFRRPATMQPLATPERGGERGELWNFINIREEDRPLLAGALVTMFHPTGPYPLITLVGQGGVAKSSTARMIQDLVDATIVIGNGQSQNSEDLMILSSQQWLITFDNLSGLDRRESDNLCRLSTGATHTRRKKFSDSSNSVFKAKRPVLLTSVHDVVTASDLLSRAVRFDLPTLKNEKEETELNAAFSEARGRILGVLLDGVASAIKNRPTTKLAKTLRMMDFGVWATAAEQGLGLAAGSVMKAYWDNRQDTRALVLDNDLARALLSLSEFKGSVQELAVKLGLPTGSKELTDLGKRLKDMAPALAEAGLTVKTGARTTGGKRIVELSK